MNVPQLRFDGFNGNWEKVLFKDIFCEKTERTNEMSKYPLFSLTVEKGVTPKTDRYERSFLIKKENDNYKIVNPNDFVYNPMNLTLGAIAKHKKDMNISVSGYYNVFSVKPEYNSDFLEMYLKSYKMILHYKSIATGSLIEKQRVHFSQFIKIKKLIPSLNEQNKIGSFFALLDQKIEKQQEKIKKLEQFKKGMMQKVFSQELRFKEYRNEPLISMEFKDIMEEGTKGIKRGPFGGALKKEIFVNEGYVVYEQQHAIYRNFQDVRYLITKQKFKELESFSLKTGDIIMSCSGTIGKIAIFPETAKDGIINQALIRFRANKNIINNSFLYHFMESDYMQKKMLSINPGSAIKNLIAVSELKKIKVSLFSLSEQQKMASLLTKLDKKIETEKEKSMMLEEQKKGFMQGMFV